MREAFYIRLIQRHFRKKSGALQSFATGPRGPGLGKKNVESKRFQKTGFPASAWNAGKAMSQAKRVGKSAFTGPLAGAKKAPSTALAEDHPQIEAIECYVRPV
ncbi:MAG: hypothetical protein ACE360_06575 [Hyphomicrobiales bacterium]